MAKKKEQELAKQFFVDFFKSQKEIAEDLGVTEKTVSDWVNRHGWKALRDAKLNNSTNRVENIKKVIAQLSESTLEVLENIKIAEAEGNKEEALKLKKESTRIAQEVGMYQKALEKMEKNFKVSLSTYLEVMEDIFKALQNFDKEAYMKTLDFQKAHLQTIAQKLG
jgi:predicted transcriptional regulator